MVVRITKNVIYKLLGRAKLSFFSIEEAVLVLSDAFEWRIGLTTKTVPVNVLVSAKIKLGNNTLLVRTIQMLHSLKIYSDVMAKKLALLQEKENKDMKLG